MPRPSASCAAALVLASALLLTACGSDEPDDAAPAPAAAPASSALSSGPSEPEPVVTPDDAQVVSITVTGGEVSGDTGRVEVPVGTTVRLSITSDVADQVHVHGLDLTQAVSPGQATQLEFVADQPGIFEVELHDSRQVLTRLQVS